MNELQIFNHPEFGQVRTYEDNGNILFCGIDVAFALGYVKPHGALSSHCRYAQKRGVPHPQSPDKMMEMVFIPESDLYRLVFRSKLPSAEKFTDWVTEEVLPSIRRTGAYSTALTAPMSPAQLIAAQAQLLVEMEQKVDAMQTQAQKLEAKVDTAIKAFSRPSEDHWKDDMDKAIKELCETQHRSLVKTRGKMYSELERVANCNIDARLSRLRSRKKNTGMTYRGAMALTKLDAIAADKKLRAIFEGIVRSWQAKAVEVEVLYEDD